MTSIPNQHRCPQCILLNEENARLKSILKEHDIPFPENEPPSTPESFQSYTSPRSCAATLSPHEKIALFRSLFRGREDVYPVRWESRKGASGYSPACRHEWRKGVCGKPKVKCRACDKRSLLPVTDQIIYEHLSGKKTIGVYPLLLNDTCWFLAGLERLSQSGMEQAIINATGSEHPLDVELFDDGDGKPWKRNHQAEILSVPMPESLTLVFSNQIYIAKDDLPQPLLNRLIRLAAFQNPEFYKAQAMRMPVWNKPRVIGCAENFPKHIGLPRGCIDGVMELFEQHNIQLDIQDKRIMGTNINVAFTGTLYLRIEKAVRF